MRLPVLITSMSTDSSVGMIPTARIEAVVDYDLMMECLDGSLPATFSLVAGDRKIASDVSLTAQCYTLPNYDGVPLMPDRSIAVYAVCPVTWKRSTFNGEVTLLDEEQLMIDIL